MNTNATKCSIGACPFFAAEGWKTCSEHRGKEIGDLVHQYLHRISSHDVLDIITQYSKPEVNHNLRRIPYSDDELLERLGLNPEDVWYDPEMIQERLFFLGHTNPNQIPYVAFESYENLSSTREFLGLSGNRFLRTEDTRAFVNVLTSNLPHFFTINVQKVLCIDTFNHAALDMKGLFPVGNCYFPKTHVFQSPQHNTTSLQRIMGPTLKRLALHHVFPEECGGGGGGGGGGGCGGF